MNDLYPRPSREAIAAMVAAQPPPPEPGDAARNYAANLTARMRALSLDGKRLAEKAGCDAPAVTIALRPTAHRTASLTLAEKIAAAVGSTLADMIAPYACPTCAGQPPKGFACLECGTETRAA